MQCVHLRLGVNGLEVHVLSRCCSGIVTANPDVLLNATDQLKQEHLQLRIQLKGLEASAKEAILNNDIAEGAARLRHLNSHAARFIQELQHHANWEEDVFFPFLLAYFHEASLSSIKPSFEDLEKDHQLGVSFIYSYNEAVNQLSAFVDKKQLAEAASHLIQACLILNDHFTMEEQLIFTLTEKVLVDLDQFFS